MKKQLSLLDKLEGNVDSLSNRIANVRTWSYVSNKSNWVENQDYWIERTKSLEDKLSDRLHEELTKTFIDKRASVLVKGLKQDIVLETKIIDEEKVMINQQYIGSLKGLKLELDLKVDALDADIKSLKKAARQNVSPEIIKRINQIIETGLIELKNDYKIYWNKYPIAKLTPGYDYLNPQIYLIVDEMIENDEKLKLNSYLQKWINEKIKTELKSLIDLKNIKETNSELRALAYHLYENNGVIKREKVLEFLKKLNQDERKKLRRIGVKFGRYHIFLFKLFKPSSVSLRTLLWKNYNEKNSNLSPPTFGLNFLEEKKIIDQNFMLLCGFEKFDNFYVRIDILERLFIMILNSKKDDRTNEIKLIPEMLNLLGCNKENFIKLIQKMNYKTYEKENNLYFKYIPIKKIIRKKEIKKDIKNNPFGVLSQLNFK
jgi:ATP-dependent RNA helicase SUPV3L1/SUV3